MAATHPVALAILNVGSSSNSHSVPAGIQSPADTISTVSTPSSIAPTHNLTHGTNTPVPAGSRPSLSPITPPTASRKGRTWHKIKPAFSSNRLNVFFSVIALAVGGYYFFVLYFLAKKAYEIRLWKDCHDRDMGLTAVLADMDLLDLVQDIANTSVCHRLSEISYDDIAKRWSQLASAGAAFECGIEEGLTVDVFLFVLFILGWSLCIMATVCDCCSFRAANISSPGSFYYLLWGLLVPAYHMMPAGYYTLGFTLVVMLLGYDVLVRGCLNKKAIVVSRHEYDNHCRRDHPYVDEETGSRVWVRMRNGRRRQRVLNPVTAFLGVKPSFCFGLNCALSMSPAATILRKTIRSGFRRTVRDILDDHWFDTTPMMVVSLIVIYLCGASLLRRIHHGMVFSGTG